MIPETQLKRVVLIAIVTALIAYFILSELLGLSTAIFGLQLQNNIVFLFKSISLIASALVAAATVRSEKVAQLILGKRYIGGTYEGISRKVDSNNEVIETHSENLLLKQNLLTTKLSGESQDNKQNHYGRWDGFVINTEPDVDFYEFVVRISTNTGRHSGFFELTIRDGKMNGYHPTRYSKWNMELSRIDLP